MKNKGSFLKSGAKWQKIHCSGAKKLDKKTKIYVDEHWEINRKIFSRHLKQYGVSDLRSCAAYYADLCAGKVDLVLECTRKNNLEIAAGHGLKIESGATVSTLENKTLDQEKYLAFGQKSHIPIVSSSTKELASSLIDFIKLKTRQ